MNLLQYLDTFSIVLIAVILILIIVHIIKIHGLNGRIESLKEAKEQATRSLDSANAKIAERDKKIADECELSQKRLDELSELRAVMSDIASDRIDSDVLTRLGRVGWGVRYNSDSDFADALRRANEQAESIIQNGNAVVSVTGEEIPLGASALVLDAFNGYSRFYIYSSNHSYARRVQYIRLAHFMVNQRAISSLHISITKEYLDAQLAILAIKSQMEEYKRNKRAEDQRSERIESFQSTEAYKLSRELEKLRSQLQSVHNVEKEKLQERIRQLERKLEENQRSISNAQLTKRGTVYVISNIGSFGENVYKIGMTRRTDPQERIDELGVASVPFAFDVHAFINTDDAPGLENELHKHFKSKKVNTAALQGREFYRVTLDEIRRCVESMGYYTKWNIDPEAEEFKLSSGAVLSETRKTEPVYKDSANHNISQEVKSPAQIDPNADLNESALIDYLTSHGIKYVDKRGLGGCLWIESTPESDNTLKNVTVSGKHFILARKTKTFGRNRGWFLS